MSSRRANIREVQIKEHGINTIGYAIGAYQISRYATAGIQHSLRIAEIGATVV